MRVSTNKLVLATAAFMMVAVGWWLREDRPDPVGAETDLPVSARPATPSSPASPDPPGPAPTEAPSATEPGLEPPTRDASGVALNPAVAVAPRTITLAAGAEAPAPPAASALAAAAAVEGDRGAEADGGEPPADLPPVTLLENHRTAFRRYAATFGGNPVGDNAEITAALRGQNRRQSVFLSANDGLRVNREGQAVDSWGTPYFFHQLSRTEMEVRSAGPDRRMWTSDDLVLK